MHYCAACHLPSPPDACLRCHRAPARDIERYCYFCEREAQSNPCERCAAGTSDTFDDAGREHVEGIVHSRAQARQNVVQVLIALPVFALAIVIIRHVGRSNAFGMIEWVLGVLVAFGFTWLASVILVRVIPYPGKPQGPPRPRG